MWREIQGAIIRWLFGLGFLGASFWCVQHAYRSEATIDFGSLLLALLLFLLGVVAIWKTVFDLATRPFMMLIDSIFFPGGKLAKPTLNLKLPDYYVREGRYDDALREYRRILKHHPDEVEAYEQAIWLHATIFDEPEEARKLLRRAKRRHLALDDRAVRMVSHPAR